jgi:hypothetical protein
MSPIKFGIVGAGWRTEFYLRLARALPERFEVTGVVVRNAAKAPAFQARWDGKTFGALDELLKTSSPAFVVVSAKWTDNHAVVADLWQRRVPALCETPPAPDVAGLVRLHALMEQGAKVQVAEQYHLQPAHAARLALVRAGLLGTVSQAQVSVAHGFHGISLIRRFLNAGFAAPTIEARRFISPLIAGPDRSGPPTAQRIADSEQGFLRLDFGDKLGIFDFTGDQYFSWIRGQRLLVRGERGEIVNHQVTYLKDFRTPIRLDLVRHEAGPDGNLEGKYLKGIQAGSEWVYTNPLAPAPLTDDEIAVGACLLGMDEYLRTGKSFYSLPEASQDAYLSLMGERAMETGQPVKAERMCWAQA